MKKVKIWNFARDSGLRWWLLFLAIPGGLIWLPLCFITLGAVIMIILIDTGEKFHRGLKGLS